MAVAARATAEVSAATDRLPARHRHRLGRADLPCGAQRAHPPRLRAAPTCSAAPASAAASTPTGRCGCAATSCRKANGRCSSKTITADSSTGIPSRPTRSASPPTPARKAHQPGTGAVREGCALLQGLATCATCGRKLAVYYDGPAKTTPGYYCTGTGTLVEGKGTRHLRVGGATIDAAVAEAFLAALQPAALQACLAAAQQLEDGHDAALAQWRRQVEQARYEAGRAERRYRAVDPDNRLVARGLETEWNTALQALADAEAELARRETARPKTLTPQEKSRDPGAR